MNKYEIAMLVIASLTLIVTVPLEFLITTIGFSLTLIVVGTAVTV